jgi:hypothetical protein
MDIVWATQLIRLYYKEDMETSYTESKKKMPS